MTIDRGNTAVAANAELLRRVQASIDRLIASHDQLDGLQSSFEAFVQLLEDDQANAGQVIFPPELTDQTVSTARGQEEPPPQELADKHAPTQLGRFRLLRQIGSGGFGIVFLAFDPTLQREVALKLPRPEFVTGEATRERILAEAQTAANLDHSGIVPIYETGTIGPAWFIVSAYCEGPTLSDWLEARPRPTGVRCALELAAQLVDAVGYAHSRGVLHRDLKPANILLRVEPADEDSRADTAPTLRLTDFGLACRTWQTPGSANRSIVGTLGYMAPEQMRGEIPTGSVYADIYSIGAILYELLTGRTPAPAESERELRRRLEQALYARHGANHFLLLQDVSAVVLKCLADSPLERYSSAETLVADVRACLGGHPVAARPGNVVERGARWCRRKPLVASLAMLLCCAIVAGISLVSWQWRRAEQNLVVAKVHAKEADLRLAQSEELFVRLSSILDKTIPSQNVKEDRLSSHAIETRSRCEEILHAKGDYDLDSPILAAAHSLLARYEFVAGNHSAAKSHYRASMLSWHKVIRRHPNNSLYLQALTQAMYGLGRLGFLLDSGDGAQFAQIENGRLLGEFELSDAQDRVVILAYADTLLENGAIVAEARHLQEACFAAQASSSIYNAVAIQSGGEPEVVLRTVRAIRMLGIYRIRSRHRRPALEALNDGIARARILIASHPEIEEAKWELALLYCETAKLNTLHTISERLALLANAGDIVMGVDSHSSSARTKRLLGSIAFDRAQIFLDQEDYESAVQEFVKFAKSFEDIPLNLLDGDQQNRLSQAYFLHARTLSGLQRDIDSAIRLFDKSIVILAPLRLSGLDSRGKMIRHSDAWRMKARLQADAGDLKQAAESYASACKILEEWRKVQPNDDVVLARLHDTQQKVAALASKTP